MTEAEWLTCTNPSPMLAFLQNSGKLSERKWRLFVCACVRRTWHLLTDPRSRRAVELAEEHADGGAESSELRAAVLAGDQAGYRTARVAKDAEAAKAAAGVARIAVGRAAEKPGTPANRRTLERTKGVARRAVQKAEQLAIRAEERRGEQEAARAAVLVIRAAEYHSRSKPGTEISLQQAIEAATIAIGSGQEEQRSQCDLLRDLVGLIPFRDFPIQRGWVGSNDGTVLKVSQAIYDERAFARLPILADALEDAGCTDTDILNHCRGPGPHVRGCWVIDLLLKKE